MFQYHPALMKALHQDRYYRLVNERRRYTKAERPACQSADKSSAVR